MLERLRTFPYKVLITQGKFIILLWKNLVDTILTK